MTDQSEHPPLYTMTFEEVEERVELGETITTFCGYLLHSRDRKLEMRRRWDIWQKDVLSAEARGDIPKLQREGGMIFPPKSVTPKKEILMTDPRPLDKKGRPFSWSFSALNNFEGCPLRYAQEKFFKTIPYVQGEAAIWGDRVHKAAENFVKGLPVTDHEAFKVVAKYAQAFKKLKDSGAVVEPELKIILDRNMKLMTGDDAWFSKQAWFRLMIDVPAIQGTDVKIFDYKTGGKTAKDEVEQLKICCAALSHVRPDLETFSGKLIYTKHDKVTQGIVLVKADMVNIWEGFLSRVKRMEDAWRSEVFPARPSGLCKWKGGTAMGGGQCGYYDKCEYHN